MHQLSQHVDAKLWVDHTGRCSCRPRTACSQF